MIYIMFALDRWSDERAAVLNCRKGNLRAAPGTINTAARYSSSLLWCEIKSMKQRREI